MKTLFNGLILGLAAALFLVLVYLPFHLFNTTESEFVAIWGLFSFGLGILLMYPYLNYIATRFLK